MNYIQYVHMWLMGLHVNNTHEKFFVNIPRTQAPVNESHVEPGGQ